MKKSIIIALSLLFCFSTQMMADEYSIYAEDLSVDEGATSATLNLYMTNTETISAIQFDIYFPEGIDAYYGQNEDEDMVYFFNLGDRAKSNHSLSYNKLDDRTYRVMVSSPTNSTFKETEANKTKPVVTVALNIASTLAKGSYTVYVKDAVLSHYDTESMTSVPFYPSNTSSKVVVGQNAMVLATSISLDKSILTLAVGENETLTATILPTDATVKEIVWNSSDENIVTVVDGIVTAVGLGTATITATADGTNLSASCQVSVLNYNCFVTDANQNEARFALNEGEDMTILDTYRTFSVTENVDMGSISYSRTYKNTNWQPWYVPFDVEITADLLNSFSFSKFAGTYVDDGKFYITVAYMNEGDVLNANAPYFIKAKTADSSNPQVITIDDATLKTTESNSLRIQSAEKNVDITGIYARKTATADDCEWYYYSSGNYVHAKSGINLGAFRFYLEMTDRDDNLYATHSANPSKIEIMEINDDPTGINEVSGSMIQDSGAVYNLNGMRVDEHYKGVIIRNGRKYLNK